MKKLMLLVLLLAGVFAGGCVPEDPNFYTHRVDPHAGREYQHGMRAVGQIGHALGNQRNPYKARKAMNGLEALGILMDLSRR